jgi:hypothetical protein
MLCGDPPRQRGKQGQRHRRRAAALIFTHWFRE